MLVVRRFASRQNKTAEVSVFGDYIDQRPYFDLLGL
jgi:hypothetical protein